MSYTNSVLSKFEFITTTSGKPKAVVINIKDWNRIAESLSISNNEELMTSFLRAKSQAAKGAKLLSLKEVIGNL